MNDAHNIHFPGATRRTLCISTSNATSDNAILIRCIKSSIQKEIIRDQGERKNKIRSLDLSPVTRSNLQVILWETNLVEIKFWIIAFWKSINMDLWKGNASIFRLRTKYSPEYVCRERERERSTCWILTSPNQFYRFHVQKTCLTTTCHVQHATLLYTNQDTTYDQITAYSC